MNMLLDTHALIWFIEDSPELSPAVGRLITDINNPCYVSVATLWEIAIKVSIGKLELKYPFDKLSELMWENSIDLLPIRFEHIQKLLTLPFHHKDPFDRIIISQALIDGLQVISRYNQFDNYLVEPIKRYW